jgi:hypothetical protein
MFMKPGEHLKTMAPSGALFYRLMVKFSNGASHTYPSTHDAYFSLGESPVGVPPGLYSALFFSDAKQLITAHENSVTISVTPESNQASVPQLSLSFLNAGGEPSSSTTTELARGKSLKEPTTAAGTASSKLHPDLATAESELEFRRYQHAMEIEERQQEFIKNSTYITEVGEVFALNRIMRKEMMEMQRVIVQNSQQAYKDIQMMKGTVHDLLQLQKEVITSAAAQIGRPPTPPPDYVGLGHSALCVVKEIGVALIHRSQDRAGGAPLREAPKQSQLHARAAETVESKAPTRTDIIEKVLNKIKSTSEFDLAMAMSSPDKWKAMMDELMTDKTAIVVDPADKAAVSPETTLTHA